MKKYLFIAIAALFMASCGGSTNDEAKKDFLEFVQNANEKIQNCTSLTEMKTIGEELTTEGAKLDEKYGSEVIKAINQDEEVQKAVSDLNEAMNKKGQELGESGAF